MSVSSDAPESITILGSTGSIGANTIKVISECKEKYRVEALTANSDVKKLAAQSIATNAKFAVIADESKYTELKDLLSSYDIEVASGSRAVVEAAGRNSDIVMSSIVGAAGLLPTMEAVKRGARVALANKETLVCAGELMMRQVKESGATLIPVDSEHSAIFQIFDFDNPHLVEKITLTASGGPFRNACIEKMRDITPSEAIAHPNWSMGKKISVDSATMMNKGLEIIEAYHLFPVGKDKIDVIVHPESIIHSMVEYVDGSTLAQLGTPDMCTPIAVALAWPRRIKLNTEKLNLAKIGALRFEAIDNEKFPAVRLAKEALEKGGVYPAIFNSANEAAVAAFLDGKISFTDIVKIVEKTMDSFSASEPESVCEVMSIIQESYALASVQ